MAEARRAAAVLKDAPEGETIGIETRVLSVEGADGTQLHKAPVGMSQLFGDAFTLPTDARTSTTVSSTSFHRVAGSSDPGSTTLLSNGIR
jgi:hypothetical protein